MKFFLIFLMFIPSLAFSENEKLKFAVHDSRFYLQVFSDSSRQIYLIKDFFKDPSDEPFVDYTQPTGSGGLRFSLVIDELDGLKTKENFHVSPAYYMTRTYEYDRILSDISINCVSNEYHIRHEVYFKNYEIVGTNTFDSYISWRIPGDDLSFTIHDEHGFKETFTKVCLMQNGNTPIFN